MNKQPLLSIIIPSYNRAHLIGETLGSIIAQTYTNWECLVVDDGSTDETEDAVNAYCAKNKRFSFYKRPLSKPKGANACRNYGLELSKGDYVVFLDSDDLLQPFCLSIRVAYLKLKPVDMLLSHTGVFLENIGDSSLIWNKIYRDKSIEGLLARFLNSDIVWSTTGVTWSKQFLRDINKWDESLVAWQDWELHVRALLCQPKLGFMDTTKQPDSYWRRDSHLSIGRSYRSKAYMIALQKVAFSIANKIQDSGIKNKAILDLFNQFVCLRLICTPLEKGYNFMPLQLFFRSKFIKGISRLHFFKVYIIQLLGKSYMLRHYVLKSAFENQQQLFVINSTHLKLHISDL